MTRTCLLLMSGGSAAGQNVSSALASWRDRLRSAFATNRKDLRSRTFVADTPPSTLALGRRCAEALAAAGWRGSPNIVTRAADPRNVAELARAGRWERRA